MGLESEQKKAEPKVDYRIARPVESAEAKLAARLVADRSILTVPGIDAAAKPVDVKVPNLDPERFSRLSLPKFQSPALNTENKKSEQSGLTAEARLQLAKEAATLLKENPELVTEILKGSKYLAMDGQVQTANNLLKDPKTKDAAEKLLAIVQKTVGADDSKGLDEKMKGILSAYQAKNNHPTTEGIVGKNTIESVMRDLGLGNEVAQLKSAAAQELAASKKPASETEKSEKNTTAKQYAHKRVEVDPSQAGVIKEFRAAVDDDGNFVTKDIAGGLKSVRGTIEFQNGAKWHGDAAVSVDGKLEVRGKGTFIYPKESEYAQYQGEVSELTFDGTGPILVKNGKGTVIHKRSGEAAYMAIANGKVNHESKVS